MKEFRSKVSDFLARRGQAIENTKPQKTSLPPKLDPLRPEVVEEILKPMPLIERAMHKLSQLEQKGTEPQPHLYQISASLIEAYDLVDLFGVQRTEEELFHKRLTMALIDHLKVWAIKEINVHEYETLQKDQGMLDDIHAAYFDPIRTSYGQIGGVQQNLALALDNAGKTFVDKLFRFKNDGSGILDHSPAIKVFREVQSINIISVSDIINDAGYNASFHSIYEDKDIISAKENINNQRAIASRFT